LDQDCIVLDDFSQIADDLLSNGLSVVTSLFELDDVHRARCAAEEAALVQDKIGAKRLLENADEVAPLKFFFGSPIFSALFHELLGEGAVSRRNRIQFRTDRGVEVSPILLFHIDSVVPRYKVFLYLSDVFEMDGPTEYIAGTHVGEWRKPYLQEVRQALASNATDIGTTDIDYNGCLRSAEEVLAVTEKHVLRRILGRAGTCVIFDTRGFHRASPLGSGSRLILSMDWMRAQDYL
jgi:hypothetical protein